MAPMDLVSTSTQQQSSPTRANPCSIRPTYYRSTDRTWPNALTPARRLSFAFDCSAESPRYEMTLRTPKADFTHLTHDARFAAAHLSLTPGPATPDGCAVPLRSGPENPRPIPLLTTETPTTVAARTDR
jgi:hypothetical protein